MYVKMVVKTTSINLLSNGRITYATVAKMQNIRNQRMR